MQLILLETVLLILLACTSSPLALAQQTKRSFTVVDEIGLTLFGGPNGEAPEVHFSSDEKYLAVWTERGDVDSNLVVDSLRFYQTQDVETSLERSDVSQPPSPIWVLSLSGKEGPIITGWRWLADSSGVGFLEGEGYYRNKRLMFADLRRRKIEPLTSNTQAVETFDIVDQRHYVYTVADPLPGRKMPDEPQTPAVVATGRSVYELLFPDDPVYRTWPDRRKSLWAAIDGKSFEVKHDHVSVTPQGNLTLSPDGNSLVTTLLVAEVPSSWETLYPPPYQSFSKPIRAGRGNSVRQYVLIDLQRGSIRALTDAPISNDAGWWVYGADPSWSRDGREILLPGTFVKSKEKAPSRPCIAVVDLPSLTSTCVEMMKGHTENGGHEAGYHGIHSARFSSTDNERIAVTFHNAGDFSSRGTSEYQRGPEGTWRLVGERQGEHKMGLEGPEVTVDQAFDKPPLLIATNKQRSLVLWDPNPQLKQLDIGQASTYSWDDGEGHHWRAGLFKPSDYKTGQRYPLVIQTHGFAEDEFRPSGVFPTAFAARALAAAGMVVLQLDDSCPMAVLSEGSCVASGYETAARQLVSEELVDPERIGIIGFSRTCYYVMEMLAFGSLRIKAASITDGMMGGYTEYIFAPRAIGLPNELNLMIGAPPFGEGLQQWLKRSPAFNLEKLTTPLLFVGEGPFSLLFMWQPYAGLRYLKKPVDLIMLNTREHVLTNPGVRLASQGGSVDWFRFWLQNYEDPDPAKAAQYIRWRELRKMQADS